MLADFFHRPVTSNVSGGFENTALNTELLDVEEGKQTKRRKQEKETIGEPPIYIYIYIIRNINDTMNRNWLKIENISTSNTKTNMEHQL